MNQYVLCGRCDMMGKTTYVELQDSSDWTVWCQECMNKFVEYAPIMQERAVKQVHDWQRRRW